MEISREEFVKRLSPFFVDPEPDKAILTSKELLGDIYDVICETRFVLIDKKELFLKVEEILSGFNDQSKQLQELLRVIKDVLFEKGE